MFYIYGILCCCFLIGQVWQNPLNWYQLQWLIPNTIIKCCEICFAWCQTLAFIILIIRMKSCESSNFCQEEMDRRLKCVDVALVVGLLVTNVLFWIFIGFLIKTNQQYKDVSSQDQKEARQQDYFDLEVVCWAVETTSACCLVASALYTIYRLRMLGNFTRESNRMTLILVIFCLAYISQSSFQWIMFA